MFYWIYTKINTTKTIISRNFATSVEGVRFANRNALNWKHGEMFKKGERYGEYLNGVLRVGSKISSKRKR